MLSKAFFQKLKKEHKTRNVERRKIISRSNPILHDSKRAIFALHRNDIASAESMLSSIEVSLKQIQKTFGADRVSEEGAYKAAVEEYVEAAMFYKTIKGKKIDKISGIKIGHDSYLAGICDLTGELVRQAINRASKGDYDGVERNKNLINNILGELVEFDMTSYLRTKYDQARGNLRKIEQISYEIQIRNLE